MPRQNIYDYMDYREFLIDFYNQQKEINDRFSYRVFSRRAGITSSGFFSDVIKGKRNLSAAYSLLFLKGLDLTKTKRRYFELMVKFNQAKTNKQKNVSYRNMLAFNRARLDVVKKHQYEYYTKWYFTAIRELLAYYKFNGNYRALGKQLAPIIRPHQAKKAIKVMANLGMIKKDEYGNYIQAATIVKSSQEVKAFKSLIYGNFHRSMLEMAKESIDRHPQDERDLTYVTVSWSKKSQIEGIKKIKALRKELMDLAVQDQNPDRVTHIHFALFPVTKVKKTGKQISSDSM